MSQIDNTVPPHERPGFIRYVSDDQCFRASAGPQWVVATPARQQLVRMADRARTTLLASPGDAHAQREYDGLLASMEGLPGASAGYSLRTWYQQEHLCGQDRPCAAELAGKAAEVQEGDTRFIVEAT